MSDRDQKSTEAKFADWLDGKLSEQEAELFERALSDKDISEQDKAWQQRLFAANQMGYQAEMLPEQEVPNWDREATFASEKQPWWQWSGLPALSMAMSFFAIALVLFKVELVVQPEGVLLSFAGSAQQGQQRQMEQMVDRKLQEFASEQQVVLANYAADIKSKQQDSNLQLASYILDTSRQERKEDMTDFIKYLNEQRKDEMLEQRIKFQQLEQAIQYQTISARDTDSQLQGINWTTQE